MVLQMAKGGSVMAHLEEDIQKESNKKYIHIVVILFATTVEY